MSDNEAVVRIPKILHQKLKERVRESGFDSVSAYVAFVLHEVLSEVEKNSGPAITAEDEERVKRRLRALGYLG